MRFFAVLFAVFCGVALAKENDPILRYKVSTDDTTLESVHVNTIVPAYVSPGRDAPLDSLQCPMPRADRVKNIFQREANCVYGW